MTAVRRWGIAQFQELADELDSLGARPIAAADRAELSHLAIDALNKWAVLMRSYYLASATGGWSADGRVTAGLPVRDVATALTFAVHTFRTNQRANSGPWTQRDEPDWLDPSTVARLLFDLDCSNKDEFGAAISVGSSARQDLATYRNFIAHRNRDTAEKVRSLAVRYRVDPSPDPLMIPLQRQRRRTQSILREWIGDLQAMTELMPA